MKVKVNKHCDRIKKNNLVLSDVIVIIFTTEISKEILRKISLPIRVTNYC